MKRLIRISSVVLLLANILLGSCKEKEATISTNKTPDATTEAGTQIISAPIVSKAFVKKNGEAMDFEEYYVQRSIQDYFIKFCESKVTRKELEKALDKQDDLIKTLTLEVEFREGEWDKCDEVEVQSRIGEYVIVHRIVSE